MLESWDGPLFPLLIRIILGWSLLSLGTSVIGLYLQPRDFCRGFWFMSGLWGLIDGIIGLAGLFQAPLPNSELQSILGLNAGLDLLYLLSGGILLTRQTPVLRGFGVAILVQGAFLLVFDLSFWMLCRG